MLLRSIAIFSAIGVLAVMPALGSGYYFSDAGGNIVTSLGDNQYQRYVGTTQAAYFDGISTFAAATTNSSSDLTKGELKARTYLSTNGPSSEYLAAVSFANFGDSFRLGSNGHLPDGTDVLNGRNFTFNLDLSGFLGRYYDGQFDFLNANVVTLAILKPGSLQQSVNEFLPFNASYNIQVFKWGIGSDSIYGNTVSSFPTQLTATFAPGGDFDWWLGIRMEAHATNIVGTGVVDEDFSHTLGVSYTAPSDVTVFSSAGFAGAQLDADTPEPATCAMAVSALVGFGCLWVRRSRQSL